MKETIKKKRDNLVDCFLTWEIAEFKTELNTLQFRVRKSTKKRITKLKSS